MSFAAAITKGHYGPILIGIQLADILAMREQHETCCTAAMRTSLNKVAVAVVLLCATVRADPMPVRHLQGYIHGFLVLKNTENRILASGDLIQIPAGNRVTTSLVLHFADGSLYEEIAVFSQSRVYRLLSYKQVMKGPAFKVQETLSLDVSRGSVNIAYTDKDGKEKTIADQLSLPSDLANGIVSMLLTEADPKVETILSMVVSTPKPRVVKLRVASSGQDSYTVGGAGAKATHYIMKIDIGGVTGVAAKVLGKQPPPIDMWIASGTAPVFLKSEGPLYEDGPVWRIELASPDWPKASKNQ